MKFFVNFRTLAFLQVVDINPLGGIIAAMKRIPPGWDIAWTPAESVLLNDSLKA